MTHCGSALPQRSALAALRRTFQAATTSQNPVAGFSGPEFTAVSPSPTLAARLRDLHDQREAALTKALATATGTAPDNVTPRATAALFGAVARVQFQRIR
ncbi:hypothetical protein [Plantactinospora sonchi]|uniref:Uncharacterized protein n=1 Tax=Plantactinospora sonchi TaxID=1544735 RepID=A0ABU7S218_9ACTN